MSWWKYAKPGDKVVCVKSETSTAVELKLCGKGEILTIANICESKDNKIGFFSHEYGLRMCNDGYLNMHNPKNFRPLQAKSTETGMKILRKIAEGERVGA